MVSTCKALLFLLSIVACVKADTTTPDVASSTQQGATSIKPFIQSKLDTPPEENAGTCTAAAKGTLQDVGDVDTRCDVSWSKEKRHVVGHFHDKTPYSTITGHWDSCAHKTVHRNEIDIATHKIDTKVLVDHCGAVTITINIPVDLKCEKQGQQWICQARLPDVECKADTKSPPGGGGSVIPSTGNGTITPGNGNGNTDTTSTATPGQSSTGSGDTTSSNQGGNGTVTPPITPPASKGKCKNKTKVGTTGPLPSVGADQTPPPPATPQQPSTEGYKTQGSQGSNAAGDVNSGRTAACNGKDCPSSSSKSSNSTDSSHSMYSSTGSGSGSGAESGSGNGSDGAQGGSSGSQQYHHTNSEGKPCDKAGNVMQGAADGEHNTVKDGGDASSPIDGLYAGAPAVKAGGRRAVMQRRSTPPSRSSPSRNKHSFRLH